MDTRRSAHQRGLPLTTARDTKLGRDVRAQAPAAMNAVFRRYRGVELFFTARFRTRAGLTVVSRESTRVGPKGRLIEELDENSGLGLEYRIHALGRYLRPLRDGLDGHSGIAFALQ